MTRSSPVLLACAFGLGTAALIAVGRLTPLNGLDPTSPRVTLADVEATVARQFPVTETDHAALRVRMSRPNVVVFDVREPAEFSVSHLPGARQVDPGMTAADFSKKFGADVAGKDVVFYCAVGVRSATMLKRTESALKTAGATTATSLRGGIFRWHASQGPLVSDAGTAHTVHHFDDNWSKLLARSVGAGSR